MFPRGYLKFFFYFAPFTIIFLSSPIYAKCISLENFGNVKARDLSAFIHTAPLSSPQNLRNTATSVPHLFGGKKRSFFSSSTASFFPVSSSFYPSSFSSSAFASSNTKLLAEPPTECSAVNTHKRSAFEISSLTNSTSVVFDIEKIKELLPHRYPLLWVDKVVEYVPGKSAVGIKQVTANENFFNGHFPERKILPGVLQVEALAQLGGIVVLQNPEVCNGKDSIFFFAGVNGVKWKKPVVPGDSLVMEVELISWNARFGLAKMKGRSFVDGVLVNEVNEMTFALVKNNQK